MSDYPGYSSPNAPQTPPSVDPGEQSAVKQKNTIATAALVTAIVGFVFAVIPGALMVGWILLPIAFVLAIVGLAQSGKPKGKAIAALIVSIVGTIAGVLAFTLMVGSAIDDAFSDDSEVVLPQDQETTDPDPGASEGDDEADEEGVADEVQPTTPAEAAPEGTRSDPVPLGSVIRTKEWEIKVISFDTGATDEVVSASRINDEPDSGNIYALIEAEATYVGSDSGHPWVDISFAFVTDAGNTIRSSDSFVSAPEPKFNDIGELYEGASGTGYFVLEIPEDQAGVLRVSPGWFADDVFVATE